MQVLTSVDERLLIALIDSIIAVIASDYCRDELATKGPRAVRDGE